MRVRLRLAGKVIQIRSDMEHNGKRFDYWIFMENQNFDCYQFLQFLIFRE